MKHGAGETDMTSPVHIHFMQRVHKKVDLQGTGRM